MVERLEINESYPVEARLRFSNLVVETGAGNREVFCRWDQPLRSYDLGKSLVSQAEKDYFKQFFADHKGSKEVFRYSDPIDSTVEEYVGQNADQSRGIAVSNTEGSQYQLFKEYSLENIKSYRIITRPIDDDDFQLNIAVGHSVDFERGVINIDNPDPSLDITWSGNFDVPVRFERDEVGVVRETDFIENCLEELFRIPTFKLVEVREGGVAYPETPILEDRIDHEFALKLTVKEETSCYTNTTIVEFDSGFERREDNYFKDEDGELVGEVYQGIRTGEDPLAGIQDVHYLLCWWHCTRGGAMAFQYGDLEVQGRGELSISLKMEAHDDCPIEAVYDVGSLEFVESNAIPPVYLFPPFTLALEPIFIDPNDASTWQGSTPQIYSGSAGGGGGGGGAGGGGGGGGISSFSGSASFDQGPPGETSSNPQYTIVQMFWAGGTLHMLLTASSSQSIYKNRLIHYRLNPVSGWNFEYQQTTSEALREYVLGGTSLSTGITYYETDTGVSYFGRGYPSLFGSNLSGSNYELPPEWYTDSGLFRFEFRNDGGSILDFIPRSALGYPSQNVTLGLPGQVVGNEVRIFSGAYSANVSSAGLNYVVGGSGTNRLYSYDRGYDSTAQLTYVDYTTQGVGNPDFANERFEEYPQQFGNSGQNIAQRHGLSESLLIQRVRYYCENEQPLCDASQAKDLVFFWHQTSFDELPVLIDVQDYLPDLSSGTNYFMQTSTPSIGKFAVDKGNYIAAFGSNMIFYLAGSGVARNINSLLSYPANYYRGKPFPTPYGMALIGWGAGALFDSATQIELAFIQGVAN